MNHAAAALELLATAQAQGSRQAAPEASRTSRQNYYIGRLMAREHLVAGDAKSARLLLLSVAGGTVMHTLVKLHIGLFRLGCGLAMRGPQHLAAHVQDLLRQCKQAGLAGAGIYRRERWEAPLTAALFELRECASRLRLRQADALCFNHILTPKVYKI